MEETKITLDTIEQDVTWITRDGRALKLEDMEPSHRRNVLRMLERRAVGLNQLAFRRYFVFPLGGAPTSDGASMMFEHAMDQFIEQHPSDWLREQPLVRRLRTLVDEDNARERRIALTLARNHAVAHPTPVKRSRGLRRE